MRAGDLDGERSLNFVSWRRGSIIASAAFMASSEIPPQGERHAESSLKTYPDAKARSVIETRRGYSLQLATRCAVSGPGLVSGGGTMNVSGRPVGETLKASSRCKRKI